MKFKEIYLGYIGTVCGFDPATGYHLVSNTSGYDLYTKDGLNLKTKQKYPVCHQSDIAIPKGVKGLTLSSAETIFKIDPNTEFNDEMIHEFRTLIQKYDISSALNLQKITSSLNKLLLAQNSKQAQTTKQTGVKNKKGLFSKLIKTSPQKDNDLTI